MERKISLPLYAGAFLISLIIFVIGIYVGTIIDSALADSIEGDVERIGSRLSSVELFLLLEKENETFSLCPLYSSELQEINEDIEKVGHKLSYLEDEKGIYDDELKKDYFILEAQSYLLSKKMKEKCRENNTLLMYFYSNKNCESCGKQGEEILKFRDSLENETNVKIYSFDGELNSPVVEAFKEKFSVDTYPSVIINGEKIEGYHDSIQLASIFSGLK